MKEEIIRKFADTQRTKNNQTNKRFKHWDHSNPLWILEGAGQQCINNDIVEHNL